jgi:dsDNA-binding SOS-regulon protein
MAVITRYIVTRNEEEIMQFETKKEADAHDKMLDISDKVLDFLNEKNVLLENSQKEELALFLASNADEIVGLLKPKKARKKRAKKIQPTIEIDEDNDLFDLDPARDRKTA